MGNELGTGLVATSNPIDGTVSSGLSGTVDSIGYRVAELERHFHNADQLYGLTANTMARKSVTPIVVTGGSDAWGTELEIHNGSTIESGSSTKKFDLGNLYVSAVGNANRITYLEFYANTLATNVAATTQAAADTVTKNGHGLANGTKLMLNTIVTSTGIDIYTVYYVVNQAANTFQLSLTLGGAAVDIQTGDGSCNYQVITQTLMTEAIVSRAGANADVFLQSVRANRYTCNTRVSCRAYAGGGTNAISFFLGVHTYIA